MSKLYLASSSPQRSMLLRQLCLDFDVRQIEVDESWNGSSAEEHVQTLALRKARGVSSKLGEGIVIGADTIIVMYGKVIGKPCSEEEARRTLGLMSGRWHDVLTAVAVVDAGSEREDVDVVRTRVWFKILSEDDIARYLATGEWRGRAGGYAIQEKGAALIREVHGDYTNVVGLPLSTLVDMLAKFDIRAF